jgi:hypothetical protein
MGILCSISFVNVEGSSLCFLFRERTMKYEILSPHFACTPTHTHACIGIIFGWISEDNALSKIKHRNDVQIVVIPTNEQLYY